MQNKQTYTSHIHNLHYMHNSFFFMKNLKILLVFASLIYTSFLTAQVTIGIDEKAAEGSLLQLKNIENAEVGKINATKGLLLPRVELKDLNKLKMGTGDEITDTNEKLSHSGLTVYNVLPNPCLLPTPILKGVHAWDGEKWISYTPLYAPEVSLHKDQDGNEFRARQFGDAGIWMIDDLRATKLADNLGGTPLNNEGTTAGHTTTFAYVYPGLNQANLDANISVGLLYDWNAATNRRSNALADAGELLNEVEKSRHKEGIHLQGICPEGWHLPTAAEWIELEKEIIANSGKYSLETIMSEPNPPLDPNNPLNGKYVNKRGKHGYAMLSPCLPARASGVNPATGKSVYEGGFALSLSGLVYNGKAINYGAAAQYATNSLAFSTGATHGDQVTIYITNTESLVTINIRATVINSNNGGYLPVRCKMD